MQHLQWCCTPQLSPYHHPHLIPRLSAQVRGQNDKNENRTPSLLFFARYQGEKKNCTVHVGPMDENALFQVSFSLFHLNQTTKIPLLPPYFLLLPLLPPQITPTKHIVRVCLDEGKNLKERKLRGMKLSGKKQNEFIFFIGMF